MKYVPLNTFSFMHWMHFPEKYIELKLKSQLFVENSDSQRNQINIIQFNASNSDSTIIVCKSCAKEKMIKRPIFIFKELTGFGM